MWQQHSAIFTEWGTAQLLDGCRHASLSISGWCITVWSSRWWERSEESSQAGHTEARPTRPLFTATASRKASQNPFTRTNTRKPQWDPLHPMYISLIHLSEVQNTWRDEGWGKNKFCFFANHSEYVGASWQYCTCDVYYLGTLVPAVSLV